MATPDSTPENTPEFGMTKLTPGTNGDIMTPLVEIAYAELMLSVIEQNRAQEAPPHVAEHFVNMALRNLACGIPLSVQSLDDLAYLGIGEKELESIVGDPVYKDQYDGPYGKQYHEEALSALRAVMGISDEEAEQIRQNYKESQDRVLEDRERKEKESAAQREAAEREFESVFENVDERIARGELIFIGVNDYADDKEVSTRIRDHYLSRYSDNKLVFIDGYARSGGGMMLGKNNQFFTVYKEL